MKTPLLLLAASIFQPQPFEPTTTTTTNKSKAESESEQAAIQRARARGQLRRAIRIASGRKARELKDATQCTEDFDLD